MSEMPPKLKTGYTIAQAAQLPDETKLAYWIAMYEADTLKYRWSDMPHPTPTKVLERCRNTNANDYFVVDIKKLKIVCDFALETFTGKAAQSHFSMHPKNSTELSANIAECASDIVLNEWKDKAGNPYLETMFGLISVKNRAALLFIHKAGFKKECILPYGTVYMNKVTDAVLIIKRRRHG